jgi:ubiquinone/menaquinone biosynthesis C-methylase UbiE
VQPSAANLPSLFDVYLRMRYLTLIMLFISGLSVAQDPWKNIYSQHAWAARDKWQKPEELIRHLNIVPGDKVADIGCHEGYMTFKLAKTVGLNGMVYAVDVQESQINKVKKRADENELQQIRTIKGANDNPNLPPDILDAAIILDTYHEIIHYDKVLQHLKTALKKGGRLVICDPIADERRRLKRAEQKGKHELSMEFVLADLRKAGFRILMQTDPFIDRTKEKGDKMWLIVAVKQ